MESSHLEYTGSDSSNLLLIKFDPRQSLLHFGQSKTQLPQRREAVHFFKLTYRDSHGGAREPHLAKQRTMYYV